jgi:dTMP kinase
MIIKFDGVDGCGKSTLSRAVAQYLSDRDYSVAVLAEFSSPAEYPVGSPSPVPLASMRIRETALDPAFDCDDTERQLLLHFLSRRVNRVDIPFLHNRNDFVVVDRSSLSNYAYATAIDPGLSTLSDIAMGGVETADIIFLIDTPIDICLARISGRSSDAVEQKGRAYFECVRDLFKARAKGNPHIRILDGNREVEELLRQVVAVVSEQRGSDI